MTLEGVVVVDCDRYIVRGTDNVKHSWNTVEAVAEKMVVLPLNRALAGSKQ